MFVHLHTHSYYSLLEAIASPGELVQTAKRQAMPALTLTDHINLSGSVEFYLACRIAGIKPIIGMELDLLLPPTTGRFKTGKIVLLAMGLEGWSNLCRLTRELLTHPDGQPLPCSIETLEKYSKDLICLTGGMRGPISRLIQLDQQDTAIDLLDNLKSIYLSDLYVELQRQPSPAGDWLNKSRAYAKSLHLPCVATHEIYYLNQDQANLVRTLNAIRLNVNLAKLDPESTAPPESLFISEERIKSLFSELPQALAATLEIAERCSLELPLGKAHYPQVKTPHGITALDLLRKKAEAGAKKYYSGITPELQQRLDYELSIIGQMGYEAVFLIVEKILGFARKQNIPTSSRGSAASSLVAHCLGITTPDPIKLNLYFERFLNPARATPPDIDTDLSSKQRDEIIQFVFETFGEERVAMVGTINSFRPRSALGDVAKAHGLSPAEIHNLTRSLPYHFFNRPGAEEDEGEIENPFAEIAANYPGASYQKIFAEASAVLNLPRHLSVHAGGVVITPGPMTDLVPVQISGNKGIVITQFSLKPLEQMGLLKIDLLGIRGLSVLGDMARTIYSWQQKEYHNSLAVLESIPADDPETARLVETGQTIGCFQIESPGMRATLKDLHAKNIGDIMAALALYRPGPLKGGFRDTFVRSHNGLEPPAHLHPALSTILGDTYGVILYQEQVLRIAHELANFDLAESDLLRRAMSHFDPGKQMENLKNKFISAVGTNKGIPPDIAAQIWDLMAAFAGYGFPKAHAASYALVSWQAAWCKVHYPAEFIAAVLANWGGYYSQRVYLAEARRLGLKVHAPHVNHSDHEFSVSYPDGEPALYMGLNQVKELTRRTIERIIQRRPYSSFEEFLSRVEPRKQEAENLVKIGSFDGFGYIPDLLKRLQINIAPRGQLSLFLPEKYDLPDWSLEQKAQAQVDLLGISVDIHPLDLYTAQINKLKVNSTIEVVEMVGERVRVAGIRQTWHRSRTANGKIMAFVTLEDLEGTIDVVVFPEIYQKSHPALVEAVPVVIEGIVELESTQGMPTLRAERIWKLN
jgi:DNA polymerase-3 subunit alpha